MKKFVWLSQGLILAKSADILTAGLYTPDFSLTINPFRAWMPLWAFFLYQAAVLVLTLIGAYLAAAWPLPAQAAGLGFRAYWNRVFWGRETVGRDWLAKTPTNLKALVGAAGAVLASASVAVGLVSTASNLLCLNAPAYLAWFKVAGRPALAAVSLAIFASSLALFLSGGYRAYRKAAASGPAA
jgi:hypothetical protein